MKKLLALIVAIILIGCNKNLSRISENDNYSDAYEATVGVFSVPLPGSFWGQPRSGTGVLLDTGLILTARHVVDVNADGFVTPTESVIHVKFFYPTAFIATATVVSSPISNWYIKQDFVFLRIANPPPSNIRLMSDYDYNNHVKVGEPIFAVGLSKGTEPPHLTVGVKSTDTKDRVDSRASLSVFYGNSGGGIYSERTGELIGIATRIAVGGEEVHHNIVPQWTIYESAPDIRKYANSVSLPYMVDKQRTLEGIIRRDFLIIYILQGIVWMYLGVVVRELYLLRRAHNARK